MDEYLKIFLMATPAFIANSIPVIAAKRKWLEVLNKPLDGHKKWRGKRIFGAHKTIRGLLIGTIAGGFIGIILFVIDHYVFILNSRIDGLIIFVLFGLLGGAGALLGDAIESFFKRQLNIPSGNPFVPFDQIDYIIGFLLTTSLIISWDLKAIIFLLICGLILNPLANLTAYLLGLKSTFW